MEDYKNRYEQALKRAKDLHDNHALGQPFTYKTCEDIFPELKESEDEKIVKAIIKLVKDTSKSYTINALGVDQKDMIDYLEKQGEQKSSDKIEPKFHEGDKLVSTKNPRLTYEVLEVGHINELGNSEYKVEIFTDRKAENPRNIRYMECYKVDKWAKLVEQNPAWSEEDERHKNTIIRAIHGAGNITPIDGELAENWLKSLKERYTWKPSNEQMRALEDAKMRMSLNGYGLCPLLQTLIDDLKKLKG